MQKIHDYTLKDSITYPLGLRQQLLFLLAFIAIFMNVVVYFFENSEGLLVRSLFLVNLLTIVIVWLQLRLNLLFIMRSSFVILPGLLTGSVIVFGDETIRIAYHGVRFQTVELASKVITISCLAFHGCLLGWLLALPRTAKNNFAVDILQSRLRQSRFSLFRYLFFFVLALAAGTETARSLGPPVWEAAYASSGSETILRIGVFPFVAVLGLIGMYVELTACRVKRPGLFCLTGSVALYVLGFCMLIRGMRLEPVACLAGIAVYHLEALRISFKKKLLILASSPLAFVFSNLVSSLRSGGFKSWNEVFERLSSSFSITAANTQFLDAKMIHFGTAGDIAATLYITLGHMNVGSLEPQLGYTYLQYLPRTLPEFVYADRPKDLAWVFWDRFGESSGGGFFELAEAYLNFNIIGVIVVPGLITFFIACLVRKLVATNARIIKFLLIAALVALLRGTWYQTFGLYKSMITALIFVYLAGIMCRLFQVQGSLGDIQVRREF